jgi:hypothetical protein
MDIYYAQCIYAVNATSKQRHQGYQQFELLIYAILLWISVILIVVSSTADIHILWLSINHIVDIYLMQLVYIHNSIMDLHYGYL